MATATATSPLSSPASPSTTTNVSGGNEKTVPAGCFDICNNVNVEASSVGKVLSMCDANSDVWRGYRECISCIRAEAIDAETTIETYIDPEFKQFIDYCASQPLQPSYPSTLITIRTVVQFVDITATDGKVRPGMLRTWEVTELKAEFTGLLTATSNALSLQTTMPTETMPAGTSATATQKPSPEPDKAWIAGSVIGVVTAILLVLAGLWFFRRHSRRVLDRSAVEANGYGKEEFIKAQLHPDWIPRGHAAELECSWPKTMPAISVNEIPAQEMPVSNSRHVEGVTG
ncbi:uncharacterized protein LY79DRAFT_553331 [Colletotrichum navitas]|uniref:Uncharacterized protein n=1 Tax=Colletotrichum navitas TaxID=681940 RepID=A0AAD8V5Y2_9PEZI|nr:uncharacterized protein LY79DRAFT_553331 [Colletotrichum navitas]KAK1590854.1 hypothetical protein LY79DRAFT_553331 [Colletotrichum navitas]